MYRDGIMVRELSHGTIIVFDKTRARYFPYYKNDVPFHPGRSCKFVTDATNTFIILLQAQEPK